MFDNMSKFEFELFPKKQKLKDDELIAYFQYRRDIFKFLLWTTITSVDTTFWYK